MAYDNEMKGVLFKNEKPGTNPNAPGYRGHVQIGGVEYRLSAWVKVMGERSKTPGKRFFSLAVTPPENPPQTKPQTKPQEEAFDDDIPF